MILKTKLPRRVRGLTLYPFIFVEESDPVLLNHEKIHYQQAKELFVLPFYIWYLISWIKSGYRNNIFEREAYANEKDLNYLKTRKKYAFFYT